MLLTDNLFDSFFVRGEALDVYRDKVIVDILELQKILSPMGIMKEDTDVHVLTDKSLIMILIWQHELFAMKHFMENSKPIPPIELID